ncbi:TonB-dependent siderophore receptor [Pseudomonas sp. GD03860]|uniref:TonB-dependent siderophore receptor n=1 Tax=Pseudomonas TaxID=286 RepID=UPI0023639A47|nr:MULTISPECIES: TonB-dependent siderophore receptor [Pseudomonas]MDD2056462.1 TonB-dependent siderophore receptor [Pseudomonas putida]MDH0638839.1 TonB-dependent siderophore receptor [Pseudomonas sp. GD03860]
MTHHPSLRIAVRHAIFCLGLGLSPVPFVHAADPASASAAREFSIAAGSLDFALTELSRATGLNIAFEPADLAGKHSRGLNGRFTVDQALERLLAGSGLQALAMGNGGFRLIPAEPASAGAVALAATSVVGAATLGELTENTGSYTSGAIGAGGKTPRSLRETPQSVSVMSKQRMEDQNLSSLTQVLDQTTGITVVGGNDSKNEIYSRGFVIRSIQTDGGAPMLRNEAFDTLPDMTAYDHVEVLRGSDGLYGGTGDPGGSINLVRKRALAYDQLKVSQSAGSWDNYRTEVDVTGPLGFDGALRGRMAMSYEDKKYFYDNADSEKHVVFGTLEADLTPETLLTVGGTYEWRDMDGYWDRGLVRYKDGTELGASRSTSLAADWSANNYKRTEYFAKVEHAFNDNWKINTSYTKSKFDSTQDIGEVKSSVTPNVTNGTIFSRFIRGYSIEQDLFDTNVSGKFNAFGLQHELLVGADYAEVMRSYSDHSDLTTPSAINVPFDINTGDAGSMPKPPTPGIYYYNPDWNQRKSGAYTTLKAQLADPLHLTLGARYSDYRDNVRTVVPSFNADNRVKESNRGEVTPFGALVLEVTEQWSLYTSYAEIFSPQTAYKSQSGHPLDPIEGETYEFGTKGELLGGALNLSSALYYTKRQNEAVSTGNGFYTASGEVVSKGIDTELSGELAPGWQAIVGYTLNLNKQRTAGDSANDGKPMSTQTPKHLFKFFTTYQLPGELERWKVGLGATIQSDSYKSGFVQHRLPDGSLSSAEAYSFEQSGYAVWNSLVEYKIDQHWTAQVNANNLFDKTYYQTVNSSDGGNWYGAPRNYMLTLRGTF